MSLKIAYCLPSLFSFGGMEKVLTLKANYFADVLGYEVTIILTDGKGLKPAFPLSPKIRVINLDINYNKIWHYKFIPRLFVYSFKQYIFRKRLSVVLDEIKPQITISMLRREINFITRINDGSKKIGELHFNKDNYRDFNTSGKRSGLKGLMARLWMRQLLSNLRRIDRFVVLSKEDRDKWTELEHVDVIYNPISVFPQKVSDCSSKLVIAAGRYVRQKGFDMLLDSWKLVSNRHPDWSLAIYGDGLTKEFEKRVIRNGIRDSVTLNGPVLNLNDKFAEASIFAFSSRFEGFGMVVTEAMSCGIPPVAFACPCGPKDIITDGVNGLLVEPENVKELADKICYLIENEDERREMGRRARERASDFKIEIIAKQWDNLFREVLEENCCS